MVDPKPIAKVMLKVAKDHVREAMRPWTVTDEHADSVIDQFAGDFNDIFDNNPELDTHTDWADRIKRLFTSVGSAAALIAESREKGVRDQPSAIAKEDLRFAIKVVEIAICPRFPRETLRACQLVPDLKDPELELSLVKYVKYLYLRYQQSKQPPQPSAP
jgi:hypothetical protein